ncbi:MAG: HAD family hydrolase [Acidobacteria bacterium]|nr:MAG: HAD family hydrolase [Acidobacteriota bacterium]
MSAMPAPIPAAVLFDLDGTLADSFAGIRLALNAALSEAGIPDHDLDWVRGHVGRGARELVRDAAGARVEGAALPSLTARYLEVYRAVYLAHTPPFPDVASVLEFAAAGAAGRVAVVSNKDEDLSRLWLRHAGLDRFVAAVVGPDTYGVRKPDPGALRPVLRGFGVAPDDALVVGDMVVDAAAAAGIGAPMIGVNAGPAAGEALRAAGAVAVLDRVGELPAWLVGHGVGWRYHGPVSNGVRVPGAGEEGT